MFETIAALGLRIISNPAANVFQKKLTENNSAILINLYSYFLLAVFCIFPSMSYNWCIYGVDYWFYAVLSGFLCTVGSICLIKALEIGEMSVLGPINSYKCIIGLILGIIFLGEIPDFLGIIGVVLIIYGSRFIFDTVKEGWSFKLLKRKDIILRFCALLCSGSEAIVLKKIILMSSPMESFILWCFTGFVFSFILMVFLRKRFFVLNGKNLGCCLAIALCLGLMQLSTNFVFERMNVGFALALFQLSSVVTVLLGYKIFREQNLYKKLAGSVIMIIGSAFILV